MEICAVNVERLQKSHVKAWKAAWLPMVTLAEPIPEPTAGCALMLNENMVLLVSEILQHGGHRQTGKVKICLDATYKISNSNWGLVICSISKHVHDCKYASSEAIPIALGWIPKESQGCLSAFLITMLETYHAKGLALRDQFSSGGWCQGSSQSHHTGRDSPKLSGVTPRSAGIMASKTCIAMASHVLTIHGSYTNGLYPIPFINQDHECFFATHQQFGRELLD